MTGPTPVIELLLIAVVVAVVTKYIRLPYTIALVLVGLALGAIEGLIPIALSTDLIFLIFLPPLLFEGCLKMELALLIKNWRRVFLLAFPGTLITTALIGGAAYYLLPFVGLDVPFAIAVLLGVMLSPTDPISVLAIFKEHGVSHELSVLVEGESLFNDGIGVVLFLIAVEVATGHHVTLTEGMLEFGREVAGGAVVGLAFGYLAHGVLRRLDDAQIEVVISLVLAYGVYLFADAFGMSGVIAVVVAGLLIGNHDVVFSMSPTTRLSLAHFWDAVSFIANSLLFLLIGLELEIGSLWSFAGAIAASFALMIVVRTAVVSGAFNLDRLLGGRPLPAGWQRVVNWGGVRGSIPLALVLGIPVAGAITAELRTELIGIVFGAVFLSLVVQGLTMRPLLARLGRIGIRPEEKAYEEALGTVWASQAQIDALEQTWREGGIPEASYVALKGKLETLRDEAAGTARRTAREHELVRQRQLARSSERMLRAGRAAIDDAYRVGYVSESVAHDLKTDVDARLMVGAEKGWDAVWGLVEHDQGRHEEEPPGHG